MTDIEKAKQELQKNSYSCVLIKGNKKYFSNKTGIAPLLEFIEDGVDLKDCVVAVSNKTGIAPLLEFIEDGVDLKDCVVADKIVGRAVAFLCAKIKAKQVYAEVLSEKAVEILNKYKIEFSYGVKAKEIINRNKTGICPMEETVLDIYDVETAYLKLKEKMEELKNKKTTI